MFVAMLAKNAESWRKSRRIKQRHHVLIKTKIQFFVTVAEHTKCWDPNALRILLLTILQPAKILTNVSIISSQSRPILPILVNGILCEAISDTGAQISIAGCKQIPYFGMRSPEPIPSTVC